MIATAPSRSSLAWKARPCSSGRPSSDHRLADACIADTRSGAPSPARFALDSRNPASAAKPLSASRQDSKLGTDTEKSGRPRASLRSATRTISSGAWNGSGASSTAWTTLQIAVTAPMPMARVSTTATE